MSPDSHDRSGHELAIITSGVAVEYDALQPGEIALVDSFVHGLQTRDAGAFLEQLVEINTITPEFAAILKPQLLAIFIHVRRLLVAADAVKDDSALHDQLVEKAKKTLAARLLAMHPTVPELHALSRDSARNLAILAKVFSVQPLSEFGPEDLMQAVGAIEDLGVHLERFIKAVALRTLHAFFESSGATTEVSFGVDKPTSERKTDGTIVVSIDVGRETGKKAKEISAVAAQLFPKISLAVKYTPMVEAGQSRGGEAGFESSTRGTLCFTYKSKP